MSTQSSHRLASYASIAAAASVGAAANADLMIFDVGTTFTVASDAGLGGTPGGGFATFSGTVELGALGTAIRFLGGQGRTSNPTNSSSFVDGSGWSMSFIGAAPFAGKSSSSIRGRFNNSKFGKANHYNPGDSVGPEKGKAASFAKGGKDISFFVNTKSGSLQEGVMDGNTFIGFSVEAEGLNGVPFANYGWLDLTVGLDESGDFFLTVNRWAYESDMGEAARIPGGVVPGVGGLAALAFGAAGLRRRRERIA